MTPNPSPLHVSLLVILPFPCLVLIYSIIVSLFLRCGCEAPVLGPFRTSLWPCLLLGCSWVTGAASAAFILAEWILPDGPSFPDLGSEPAGRAISILACAGATSSLASLRLLALVRRRYVEGPDPLAALERRCAGDVRSHLAGRVVLITGANAGIGRTAARQFLGLGAHVVFACRSEVRAREAMGWCCAEVAAAGRGDGRRRGKRDAADGSAAGEVARRAHFVPLDLSSVGSVRECAAVHLPALPIFRDGASLDVVVLNAGLLQAERRVLPNGWETTVGCNHLGHFLLANLLVPRMAEHGKIITVTSSTHRFVSAHSLPEIFDDLMCGRRNYTMFGQYAVSKLCNLLFALHLPQVHGSVRSYAVHPGMVRTDVVKNMSAFLRAGNAIAAPLMKVLQKRPEQGCRSILHCALLGPDTDEAHGRGEYYVNGALGWRSTASEDAEFASKLWSLSEELVGLDEKKQ